MPKPTTFTEARAIEICARIAQGEPLCKICEGKGMPWVGTVLKWRVANPSFDAAFMRARVQSADVLVDQMQALAADPTNRRSSEDVQATRLHIDTLKWIASKMRPQAYGDRLEVRGDMQLNIVVQKYVETKALAKGVTVESET